ncbi:cupin domain-containing protein [Sodalinema gerasimenkoae]|uniref:cupin domain-containing protein n=1 Tax=Sodalinema gerasimenkoae TaxID=2862348 RepID=UPI00135BB1AD|nr:cupin domain-containing protein [Sodalinema gerasimenkoae]
MTYTAADWIEMLGLVPLPEEGGMYRELYRSDEIIPQSALPDRFGGDRTYCTSIYYLLEHPEFSAFHRIRQEEIWHFYEGSPLTLFILTPQGDLSQQKLGRNFEAGERLQVVIRRGDLFAATVDEPGGYSLVGCTVAPGFEFADFEAPSCQTLLQAYPQHRGVIEGLTR